MMSIESIRYESALAPLQAKLQEARQALQRALDRWEGGPGQFERTGEVLEAAIDKLERSNQ